MPRSGRAGRRLAAPLTRRGARTAAPSRAFTLLTAALAVAVALPARGAEERALSQSIRERWTYRDGLPHNTAHRLLAARTGYLWIGTQEGLVRFDGVRFHVHAVEDTPGLAGNEISALLEVGDTLWIGTGRGLSRLDGDAFTTVALGADAAVTDLAPDGEGGVWVATEAHGVRRVNAAGAATTGELAGLARQRVLALARVGEALWIGGTQGLARLEGGRLEHLGWAAIPDAPVVRIVGTRDGSLWVGTAAGLARRRPGAAAFERVPLAGAPGFVGGILEDRTGAVWLGGEGARVQRLSGDHLEALAGRRVPESVQAMVEDANGDLWFGSESGGLYRWRWGQALTIATEEGLAHDVVWAVHGSRDGGMWVVSDAGLDLVTDGRPRRAHAKELGKESLGGLLEDRAGRLWVGTPTTIWRFGPGGAARFGTERGLAGALTRALHEDARGTIWAGTAHGVYRLEGERFRAVESDPRLAGDRVNAFAELPDGGLWVGTTTGLARVEGDRLVPPPLPDPSQVRGDVTALRADADGTLWIGTLGDGLLRLLGGRVQRFTRREGLPEDTVYAILDDGAGHLWLSGSHGIVRVSRAELGDVADGRRRSVAPMTFGTADGMRERECNGGVSPAAWRADDGRLWFATIHGAVALDPARVEANPRPPPVRVEELVADARVLSPAAGRSLPAGTRRLEVRYTGLDLSAADRLRFRHRLVGLDDGFVDVRAERVAHYTNLGPGRYTFEVMAANGSGAFGAPATLAFEIEPHLWQTRAFGVSLVALLVALIVIGPLLRIRALRRQEAALAARVEEEVQRVRILRGLLPTCAWCSKIRDEAGNWQQFEAYVSARADVTFTHGMCPECFARHGGQLDLPDTDGRRGP
ncbi:MAG: two-component regulator propeller domain-containing protein [Anaeromyxobacteraceae bacterium]